MFAGDTRAKLNGEDEIILHIEWDPVKEGEEAVSGHVTGYDFADDDKSFMRKGTQQFRPGDKIEFIFDYYDEEGKLVATEPYGGSLRVTKQESLTVEDQPLEPSAIEFLGVLTDVYQRQLMTEVLEAYIE